MPAASTNWPRLPAARRSAGPVLIIVGDVVAAGAIAGAPPRSPNWRRSKRRERQARLEASMFKAAKEGPAEGRSPPTISDDGLVVFLDGEGGWTVDIAEARVLEDGPDLDGGDRLWPRLQARRADRRRALSDRRRGDGRHAGAGAPPRAHPRRARPDRRLWRRRARQADKRRGRRRRTGLGDVPLRRVRPGLRHASASTQFRDQVGAPRCRAS